MRGSGCEDLGKRVRSCEALARRPEAIRQPGKAETTAKPRNQRPLVRCGFRESSMLTDLRHPGKAERLQQTAIVRAIRVNMACMQT